MSPRVSDTISDTTAHDVTGMFACDIEADAVFASVTGTLTGYSGVTYVAGRRLFFNATSLTLTSGTITVYRH